MYEAQAAVPEELLGMAEALRKVQHDTNKWDYLARQSSAWGHLEKAIVEVMTYYFKEQGMWEGLAERVVHECYDNGEDLKYQLQLLKDGVLKHD